LRFFLKKQTNYFPMQVEASAPSLYAFLHWIKSNDLIITGRFHGVCFAAICDVPFLAYPSNSHKVEGLLKDMNCEDLLVRNTRDALRKKQAAISAQPKIRNYVKRSVNCIENLFDDIRKIADEEDLNSYSDKE